MATEYKHYSNYFYGNEVSEYGKQHGYVDYRTLAKAFDAVMNNSIMEKTMEIGYWEQESGFVDNSEEIEELRDRIDNIEYDMEEIKEVNEDYENSNIYIAMKNKVEELEEQIRELEQEQDEYPEIYQYFIVDGNGAEILERYGEIVFYNEELDMYVWGVTHWGTSWDYVLTDIKICEEEE